MVSLHAALEERMQAHHCTRPEVKVFPFDGAAMYMLIKRERKHRSGDQYLGPPVDSELPQPPPCRARCGQSTT